MHRFRAGLSTLALLALFSLPPEAQDGAARPNVVVIVADDLGYGDLACYGGWCRTPNIDGLAAEGALFTQAYAAAAVDTPSRVGLLTGRMPARLGVQANTGINKIARKRSKGLPGEAVTLAERLDPLDVHSGLIGKWSLGLREGMTPVEQGFDEFFGFLGVAHAYLPGAHDTKMMRGTELEAEGEPEYLTDAFARESEAFLVRNKERPFVLFASFNAPQAPYEASPAYLQRFPNLKGQKQAYAAVVSALDDAVGRILATLAREGLAERTLVFFTSDNGAPPDGGPGRNEPFAMGKGYLFEGGQRVPLLVRWPGRVSAGTRIAAPVSQLDLAPTLLALAGASAPAAGELDGLDLAPLLAGASAPERTFFWKQGASAAIRKGDWKLVVSRGSRWLFDLAQDPGERNDLADAEPERKLALVAELEAWMAGLPEQLWTNEQAEAPVDVLGKSYWLEF